jgi:putative acetyltransferase
MIDFDIRIECPADIPGVRAVNKAAFETGAEAALVDALRENGKFVLSLVADIGGQIVGHILFTNIEMEPGGAQARMLGLAPMAVRPEWQGRGIGSALVRRGLEDCRDFGYRGVVVLGHPNFYLRFGFTPASSHGISSIYDAPDEAFMAVALGDEELPKGLALYQPEFADV